MTPALPALPANLRALNVCRTADGFQANLQTDDMPNNAFRVCQGVTADEALREVVAGRGREAGVPPPPY